MPKAKHELQRQEQIKNGLKIYDSDKHQKNRQLDEEQEKDQKATEL